MYCVDGCLITGVIHACVTDVASHQCPSVISHGTSYLQRLSVQPLVVRLSPNHLQLGPVTIVL
jgi:hypothetical protein